MKPRNMFYLFRYLLVCMLAVSVVYALPGEVFGEENSFCRQEHLYQDIGIDTLRDSSYIVDCPEELDESIPYRIVLQIIDNVFHKWKEYEIEETGDLYIVLKAPEYRKLSASEAEALYEASSEWVEQTPDTNEGYTLDPSHPSLNLPGTMKTIDSDLLDLEILHQIQPLFDPLDNLSWIPIEMSTQYPFNTAGFVETQFPFASGRGSGFLVSPHVVLTNAHNVYSRSEDDYITELNFSPGQAWCDTKEKYERPYDTKGAVDVQINPNYIAATDQLEEFAYDYAAVYLEEPFEGISTFMPLVFHYEPETIEILGYPSEVPFWDFETIDMWWSAGASEVFDVDDRLLAYNAYTYSGSSGSPVGYIDEYLPTQILAVHAAQDPGTDIRIGPRFTDHNKADIEEWMQWKPDEELSDDASLSHLEVDPGELIPVFDPGTTEYSVNVAHDIDEVEVTAVLADDNASLSIDGQAADSGAAEPVALGDPGTDTVTEIEVVAEDEETTKQYTITISREEILEAYSLEVSKEGEGTIFIDEEEVGLPYTEEYDAGVEVKLEASSGEDWAFEKWVVNGMEHTASEITVTMDDDKLATAYFKSDSDTGLIPDPNLEQAIRDELNKPEGDITEADMESIITLNASQKGIEDLTGLEYAVNLEELAFWQNEVSNLEPLENLTSLTILEFPANQLSDIGPLSNLTNLEVLAFAANQVIDITPLENLTNLEFLHFAGNQVEDISPLADLDSLQGLFFHGNQVSNIEPLANLTNLEELWIGYNQISDITYLQDLTNLIELRFPGNQVNDINVLANLTNLEELAFWENEVSDIGTLVNMTNLKLLDFSSNQVEDVEPLSGLLNLERLIFWGNQVENLEPLENLVNLERIHIGGNQVEEVEPLSDMVNLDWLDFSSNQVEDIGSLNDLVNLRFLNFSYNQISNIEPLSDMLNLEKVHFAYNQVEDLEPLRDLVNLQELLINNNLIADINPLSNLTNLQKLWVQNNYLDISEGTEAMLLIQQFIDDGVEVEYEPQEEKNGLQHGIGYFDQDNGRFALKNDLIGGAADFDFTLGFTQK